MNRIVCSPILVIVLIAVMHSCTTDDEFLEPTTIELQVKMINTVPFDWPEIPADNLPAPAVRQSLVITKGTFQITELEFNGTRVNNDDYYFSRSFDSTLVADLSDNSFNQPVTFDIPRGSYNPITITLHTNKAGNLPGFKLQGKWKKHQGSPGYGNAPPAETDVEINFFDHHESLDLTVKTDAGNKQIVFDGNNWNTLELKINLAHLFRNTNPDTFDTARVIRQNNKPKIIISAYQEDDIYFNLVNRIEKSIHATIK